MQKTYIKETLFGLVSLLAIGSLVGFFWLRYQSLSTPEISETTVTPEPTQTSQPAVYTLTQVSSHASPEDCWLVIENKVYAVTDFISKHPGGAERIIAFCGKDATQAFNTKGGKGFHSAVAKQLLSQHHIGQFQVE